MRVLLVVLASRELLLVCPVKASLAVGYGMPSVNIFFPWNKNNEEYNIQTTGRSGTLQARPAGGRQIPGTQGLSVKVEAK